MNISNDFNKLSVQIDSKYYSNKKIINNLKFEINKGEFVSIVGPFGSGKSTILKILSGLIDDYSGDIHIFNKTIKEVKKEHKIGMCSQKSNLLPWINVLDNICLPLKILGDHNNDKGLLLLQNMNLQSYAKASINTLSGGTQQLIALLRSLVLNPDILLLDEPLSSIDEINRISLQNEILKIHQLTKKTTVIVTHSIDEAVFLSDRVIVLSKQPTTVKTILPIILNKKDNSIRYKSEFQKLVCKIRIELE